MVICTAMLPMFSGGVWVGSSDSRTRSANFPGRIEPSNSSRKQESGSVYGPGIQGSMGGDGLIGADAATVGSSARCGRLNVEQGVRKGDGSIGTGGPGDSGVVQRSQRVEVRQEARVHLGEVFGAVVVDEARLGYDHCAAVLDQPQDFRWPFGAVLDSMAGVRARVGAVGGGDGVGGGNYGLGFYGVEGQLAALSVVVDGDFYQLFEGGLKDAGGRSKHDLDCAQPQPFVMGRAGVGL